MTTDISSSQHIDSQMNSNADIRNGTASVKSTSDRTNAAPVPSTENRTIQHAPSAKMNEQTGVHPSAVGSGTAPNTGSSPNPNDDSTSEYDKLPGSDEGYPEQKHAGKVGYGPNYSQGAGFTDKVVGLKEEIKGKLTRNHELIDHGRDRRTGELKRRERENDDHDPFATPEEQKKPPLENAHNSSTSVSTHGQRGEKEEAATVAPEGTKKAEVEKKGEAVDDVKNIG